MFHEIPVGRFPPIIGAAMVPFGATGATMVGAGGYCR